MIEELQNTETEQCDSSSEEISDIDTAIADSDDKRAAVAAALAEKQAEIKEIVEGKSLTDRVMYPPKRDNAARLEQMKQQIKGSRLPEHRLETTPEEEVPAAEEPVAEEAPAEEVVEE